MAISLKALITIAACALTGCSTVYSLSTGSTQPYSGTALNIRVIKATTSADHSDCGLPDCSTLWGFYSAWAVTDFIPSALWDTVLLPFTLALQTQPVEPPYAPAATE